MTGYPRDLVGYADQPPDPRWPGGARLAVNFVVNYEEGGERSVLHGDKVAETRLSDLVTGCTAFCASSVRPMDLLQGTIRRGSNAPVLWPSKTAAITAIAPTSPDGKACRGWPTSARIIC